MAGPPLPSAMGLPCPYPSDNPEDGDGLYNQLNGQLNGQLNSLESNQQLYGVEGDEQALFQAAQGNTSLTLVTSIVRAAQTLEQFAVGTQPFPIISLDGFAFSGLEDQNWVGKASKQLAAYFNMQGASQFRQAFGYSPASWSGRFELAVLEPANPDGDWLVVAAPTVRNVALLVNGIVHAAHPRKSDNSGAFTAFGNVLLFARRRLSPRIELLGLPNATDAMHRLWQLPAMQRSLRALEKTHSAANLLNQFGWLRNLSIAACDEDGTQIGSMAGLTQILTPDGRRLSYSGQFDATYMSHHYKTRLCTCPEQAHDRDACHFGHVRTNGKGLVDIMDVRRPVTQYAYAGTWCPEVITTAAYGGKFKSASYRTCSRGASCGHCHSCIEYFYHPHNYRTSRCKGCSRPHLCAFWHNELERRSTNAGYGNGRSPGTTPKVGTPDLVTPTMRSPVATSAASGSSSRATSPNGLGMDLVTAAQMPFGSPASFCPTPTRSGSGSSEDVHHAPSASAQMAALTSRMQELVMAAAVAGQNPQAVLASQAAALAAAAAAGGQPSMSAPQPLLQLTPCPSNDDSWLPDEALKLYLGPTLTEVLESSGTIRVPASNMLQGGVPAAMMMQQQMQMPMMMGPGANPAAVAELLARRLPNRPSSGGWAAAGSAAQTAIPDAAAQLALAYGMASNAAGAAAAGTPVGDSNTVHVVANLSLMAGGKAQQAKVELRGLPQGGPATRILDALRADYRYGGSFAAADASNTLLMLQQLPPGAAHQPLMLPVARLHIASWDSTVGSLLTASGVAAGGAGYVPAMEVFVHTSGAPPQQAGAESCRALKQLCAMHYRFLEEACRAAALPEQPWLRSRAAQLRWLRTWLEAAFELAAAGGDVWWVSDARQPGKTVLCFNTGLPSKNAPGQQLYAFLHANAAPGLQPFMLRRGFMSLAGSQEEACQLMRTLQASSHYPPDMLPRAPLETQLQQLAITTGGWQAMVDACAGGAELERIELELIMSDPVLGAAIGRFTDDLIAIGIGTLSAGSLHSRAVSADLDGHPEVVALECLAWLMELHATCTFAHPVSEAARQLQALLEALLDDVDTGATLPLLLASSPLPVPEQPPAEGAAETPAADAQALHMLQWCRQGAAVTLRSTGLAAWGSASETPTPLHLQVNFAGSAAAQPETLLQEFTGEKAAAMLAGVIALATPEWWGPDPADPWVLREALSARFAKALEQGSLVTVRAPSNQDVLLFNTGLTTEQADDVFVLFKRTVPADGGPRPAPWLVCEVARGRDVAAVQSPPPAAAVFETEALDASGALDANEDVLLAEPRTRTALRAALPGLDEAFWGTLLAGGIQRAWREASQGAVQALPAFQRGFCHLLPLALDSKTGAKAAAPPSQRSPTKLVLAVVRDGEGGGCRVQSLLPLGVAYAAARIVAPVQQGWLAEAVAEVIAGRRASAS